MAERLGANFAIDITQLQAGLRTANKLIRESKSEFQAAAAGMDDWTKSEDGLRAKINSLNSITDVQKKKVEALQKNYNNLIKGGLDPASDRAIQLRTQINNETASLEKNKAEVAKNEKALDELGKETDDAADSASKAASGGFTVLKGVLANLAADAIRKCIDGLTSLAKNVVAVGIDFDSAMSQVAAVSGATAEEVDALTEKAKEMGSKTKFSATESAEAFNYMAMAGWKTEEMLGGIEGIMSLAAASGSDLATTSDIVTDALTAMGYKAKDAGRLADVMAAASSNANTNVEMMGQTFQYAAPIVGALGYSMEDTAVAIGLMANAGIKGEKAGTALRSVLTRLSAPPKECADAMTQLGISITDSNGKMKSFDVVMGDLREAFADLGETEQTAMAKHIAGQEAMSGLLAIVNAAPEDFEKLTKAVEESNGAAQEMSNTMMDNLGGDITLLKSAWEGFSLTLFESANGAMREVVQEVTNGIIPALTDLVNGVEGAGDRLGESVGKILSSVVNTISKAAPDILKAFVIIIKSVLTAVLKAAPDIINAFLSIIPELQKAFHEILPLFQNAIVNGTIQLINTIAELIPTVVDAMLKITPQLTKQLLYSIPSLLRAAVKFFTAIVEAIPTVITSLLNELPSIIKIIISIITNAIPTVLNAAIQMLMTIVDAIPTIVDALIVALPEIIETIFSTLFNRETMQKITDGSIQLLMTIVEAIPTILTELMRALPDIINTIVSTLFNREMIQVILDNAIQLLMGIINAIPTIISTLVETLPQIFETIILTLFSEDNIQTIVEGAVTLLMGIVTAIPTIIMSLVQVLPQIISTIVGSLTNPNSILLIIKAAVQLFMGIIKAIPQVLKSMGEAGGKLVSTIVQGIKDAIPNVVTAGGDLIRGLWDGIKDTGKWLKDKIGGFFGGVVDNIKSFFGIASPSKLMENLIGKNLALGIGKGFAENIGDVNDQINKAIEIDEIKINRVGSLANRSGQSVVVNQYNTYSQAHSRYEIYKSKQQTAAAVRLALGTV